MEEKTKKVIKVSVFIIVTLLVLSIGISILSTSDTSSSSGFSEVSGNPNGNIQLNILPSNSGEIIENEN